MKKFYITTPIYYVNAKPHIGHTYTTIAADCLARYHKMRGERSFFLTGTDEHGAKIEEKAKEAGQDPQAFTDEVSDTFKKSWIALDIAYDRFIRTTDGAHMLAVQKALQKMYDQGDIYKGEYAGLYCRGCEQYKSEKDLVDGMCPEHKTVPERMSEECYMFRMSKYQDALKAKIESSEFRIMPEERRNEISSFYKNESLQDVAFSRKNVKWGIPLPWDKTHTVYVWADAFLNYLTGLGWDGTVPLDKGGAGDFWPADIQLMSKDILRVHATIWPAMLLSLGLPLPKSLFIHGYFLIDGQKMSKSLGNVISPDELVAKYGADAARYLVVSAAVFGYDGDIGWGKFDERYNADLANGLGNLVARTLTMVEKYFHGQVSSRIQEKDAAIPESLIQELFARKESLIPEIAINWELDSYVKAMENVQLDAALNSVTRAVKLLDGYISIYKPFKLIKENEEMTAGILYNCLESIRIIAWMAKPFMPGVSEKIFTSLGLDAENESKKSFIAGVIWGGLKPGDKIRKSESLFPRINF